MANIIPFHPGKRTQAQENLAKFIRLCRDELTVFNDKNYTVEWDDYCWKGINYTKLGTHSRSHTPENALHEDFIDFAKAYFRFQQGIKRTVVKSEQKALVLLEKAFLDLGKIPNIIFLDEDVLDEAAAIAKKHYSPGAAYHAGRELAVLAKFVSDKNITETQIDWISPIRRRKDNNKTGMKAKEDREKKMPNEEGMNAIAEIFSNNPTDYKDIYTTTTFVMLLSSPSRITEVHELPVFCDDIPDEFLEYKDKEGDKATGYGFRFRAGKGYDPEIKWIPTVMQDLAKDALEKIKKMTQPARDFALAMEKVVEGKSTKFPRHPSCPNVGDDEPLTVEQAARAMGYSGDAEAYDQFLKSRKLKAKDGPYTLTDLLPFVIKRLPADFPFVNKDRELRYSDALYCMFKNQLHEKLSTTTAELWMPIQDTLNHQLGPRKNEGNRIHRSIFDRWGYNDNRDVPIKITSHALRHLLNTIAQRGGMSQEHIAKWSGRADQKQNATYNHVSPKEKLDGMRKRINKELQLFGSDCVLRKEPVSITEFMTLEIAPVHSTEFGYCEHDYSMTPCHKFRDCVNCEEEVCIKGDAEKLKRMQNYREHLAGVVERDERAICDGEIGSEDQSYLHNKLTLMRLNKKIELLESDEVLDGTQIRLANEFAITPYERAVASRKASGLDKGNKSLSYQKALEGSDEKISKLKRLIGGVYG